jgi:uncharacterized phiE125 gp8 family phage protein
MPILYGSSRIRRFVRDVIDGADGLDLVWAGDSNTGYNGFGWADGFADGLTRAGARMYATNAYAARNDYGTSGYRSLQWASMATGAASFVALQDSSTASSLLKMHMGRGNGSLTIDATLYDGGAVEASNAIQNEWAIWLYARGPDGTFTEPCPIGLDGALTWRGQVNIGTGGSMKANWLTLANAGLGTTTTFNTVSAANSEFYSLESTLPAGSRLASMTAAGTGVKVALAGSGVGAPNQINGPVRIGLHSVYTARKGYASNIFEWRGGATLSNVFTDVTQAAAGASSLMNFLQYVRDRQVAAGGTGRVAFWLQGGVNSGDWSPNNASIIITRINATLDAVRSTWAKLGYDPDNLALVVMCSHVYDAGDASLVKLRDAMRDAYANSLDTAFVDLSAVADFTRMTSEGWYDSGGNSHLEELRGGYETMAATVVAEMTGDAIAPQVTVAQIKTALKIDYTDDDAELERLRDAATAWVERYTGLKLGFETRTARLRSWGRHCFHDDRVSSISSVTYVSGGSTVTMPADDYWLDDTGELAAVEFLEEPERDDGTVVTVTYVSGYESLPREVVQAIISTVGHWYNNPEAAQAIGLSEVPLGCKMMLDHLRIRGPFS